jgi:hypothetical protein
MVKRRISWPEVLREHWPVALFVIVVLMSVALAAAWSWSLNRVPTGDYEAVLIEARELMADFQPTTERPLKWLKPAEIPAAIKGLRPIWVVVTQDHVFIQISGGLVDNSFCACREGLEGEWGDTEVIPGLWYGQSS